MKQYNVKIPKIQENKKNLGEAFQENLQNGQAAREKPFT